MPIDAYSMCPGGTGKKIKFCCDDLVGELQAIDRMLEGKQFQGALRHVEGLLEKTPERACLMSLKTMLLRATEQYEAAKQSAALFLEKHPDNVMALAESAMLASMDNSRVALEKLMAAMVASGQTLAARVYEAMSAVAQALLIEGHWFAARSLLQFQAAINQQDPQPKTSLMQAIRSLRIPLLFKHDQPIVMCPDDVSWKTRFDEAVAPLQRGDWAAAERALTALAENVDGWPQIWQNLATLRGWRADSPGCIEALRKFAQCDIPLDDAVEAEATAMLLDEDPLDDMRDVFAVTWGAENIDQLDIALGQNQSTVKVPFDPAMVTEEGAPPPKASYWLLDRPMPENAEGLGADTVPRLLGQAMLYGRQTDREGRFELLGVHEENLEAARAVVAKMAGGAMGSEIEQKVMTRVSASMVLMTPMCRGPEDTTQEQATEVTEGVLRDAVLNRWPETPLGIFGGKTPRQVAGNDDCRIKLLAAILVLESFVPQVETVVDFNELRAGLGLPELGPVDLSKTSLGELPPIRLSRLAAGDLSDEDLTMTYRVATAFSAATALRHFAEEIIQRPSFAGKDELVEAYEMLVAMEENPQRAFDLLEEGRRVAESAGQSSAMWDLREVPLRVACGETEQAIAMIQHVQAEHLREPGVADALTNLLVQMGVIHPDGTPAADLTGQQDPGQPAEQPAQESKLWTPGSEQPGGEKKLWTPD